MKKLLIISPHFSTGGAPQVTLNKIQLLKDEFEIVCVEYAFLAWNFVVQRNQIINIVGDNFKSLGENKMELLDIIESFNPDVISMEEFPEMFMDDSVANLVYIWDRNYKIIETTHDSSFPADQKRWMPDEFVFVSAHNMFRYSHLDVPMRVIEYPVDDKVWKGSDDDCKYIAIVGLWTPRKNQVYAVELARKLIDYKVDFQFIGNQAGNFEDYWKPLMKNLPSNCTVMGEMDNVSGLLKNYDMFLFPSKGDKNNKELNPIAIKEALQYKEMPKLMYNLDVYHNKYDDYEDVSYLTGDVNVDARIIKELLHLTKSEKELVVIGTYPNTPERERLTIGCIKSLKGLGRDVLVVSHYPLSKEIQELANYCIYDDHNPLIDHSYYNQFSNQDENHEMTMKIGQGSNQSLTVLTNLVNAQKFAKAQGYTHLFYNTFDVILDEKDVKSVDDSFKMLKDEWKSYVAALNTPFGNGIQTNGMTFEVDTLGLLLDDVRTADEFNLICKTVGAQNFLEDYLMKKVNRTEGIWVTYPKEGTFLTHSGLGKSSNSEYYEVLPVEGTDDYVLYFFSYNEKTTKIDIGDHITKSVPFKTPLIYPIPKGVTQVSFTIDDEHYVELPVGPECKDNGLFTYKTKVDRPKIKLVHIQTTLDDEREQASRASLQQVQEYGWEYILHRNEPYGSLPPIHNCNRPKTVSLQLFNEDELRERGTALTPAHYGCYEAFKNGILSEFNNCDYFIICEGDCLIEGDVGSFIHKVEKCALMTDKYNIGFMSFGDKDTLEFGWPQSPIVKEVNEDMYVTEHLIGMQCIMFPKFVEGWLKFALRTEYWDAADMYFNHIFYGSEYNMGIVYNRMATQADGYSLIDKQFKTFRK